MEEYLSYLPPRREWRAYWIWLDDESNVKNRYAYFRRSFQLKEKPDIAIVRVSADSRYQLFVNGKRVGRGPARCEPEWQYYDEWDIAPYLKEGENVIGALVHFIGESTAYYVPGRPGFLLEGEVGGAIIDTGAEWRCRVGEWDPSSPRMLGQLGFTEIRDGRRTPVGWNEPGYDDNDWRPPYIIGKPPCEPWRNLVPRDIPAQQEVPKPAKGIANKGCFYEPGDLSLEGKAIGEIMFLRRRESGPIEDIPSFELDERGVPSPFWRNAPQPFPPEGIELKDGEFVVIDFGEEVTGYIQLELEAEEGMILDIGHGEYLLGTGVPRTSLFGQLYADRYISRSGHQIYETFEKRGFRYVLVDVKGEGKIRLLGAKVLFSTYPVRWHQFACSDPRLNEIWRLSAYTLQLNMEDGYTDCPWRERGQWWGDARVEILENFYAFGDQALARKGMFQMAQNQDPKGRPRAFVPTRNECYIPTWTFCWPISMMDYYQFTGDKETLRRLWKRVDMAMRYYEKFANEGGLLCNVDEWVFIDWTNVDVEGCSAALNAFYYGALRACANIAEIVGDEEGKKRYEELAGKVKESFNKTFWLEDKGVYCDAVKDGKKSPIIGQPTNACAIHFGLADEKAERILEIILNDPNVVKVGSPYMSFYLLNALRQTGKHDEALEYIRYWWGVMLEEGDTATREVWQIGRIMTGEGASRAHGWSAAPAFDLPAYVLGARPLKPGWEEVLIEPHPSGLKWCYGVVPTPQGEIRIHWKQEKGKPFEISVELPKGVKALVKLPDGREFRLEG